MSTNTKFTAWVENVDGEYRATAFSPSLTGIGRTAQEALDALNRTVAERVHSGAAQIVELPIADTVDHPWRQIAGMFADDADYEAWQGEIQSYRREQDREETTW